MVKVLLAGNHEVVRNGSLQLLAHDPRIKLLGNAANLSEAITKTRKFRPNVLILDMHMPLEPGLSISDLHAELNACGAQVLGIAFPNDEEAKSLAHSIGVIELLDKISLGKELIPAILRLAFTKDLPAPTAPAKSRHPSARRFPNVTCMPQHSSDEVSDSVRSFLGDLFEKTQQGHTCSECVDEMTYFDSTFWLDGSAQAWEVRLPFFLPCQTRASKEKGIAANKGNSIVLLAKDWRNAYEAALFEPNPSRLGRRIYEAEKAVIARAYTLFQSKGEHQDEEAALDDAMYFLQALRSVIMIVSFRPTKSKQRMKAA